MACAFVATVGEEYSQLYTIASLVPEWEFNAQFTHYYDDPRDNTDSYSATSLYVKRRLQENEAQTAGYAFLAGTGMFPEYLEQGQRNAAFDSWWAMGVASYNFAGMRVVQHRQRIVVRTLANNRDVDFHPGIPVLAVNGTPRPPFSAINLFRSPSKSGHSAARGAKGSYRPEAVRCSLVRLYSCASMAAAEPDRI